MYFTNKGVSMFVAGTMEQYLSKALLLFNPRGTKRSAIPILKSALILLLTFILKRDIFNTEPIFDFPHRQLEP